MTILSHMSSHGSCRVWWYPQTPSLVEKSVGHKLKIFPYLPFCTHYTTLICEEVSWWWYSWGSRRASCLGSTKTPPSFTSLCPQSTSSTLFLPLLLSMRLWCYLVSVGRDSSWACDNSDPGMNTIVPTSNHLFVGDYHLKFSSWVWKKIIRYLNVSHYVSGSNF